MLNTIAHGCYAVYSTNFLFNERVREQYRRRHDGHDSSVMPNDVAFSMHVWKSRLVRSKLLIFLSLGIHLRHHYLGTDVLLSSRRESKIVVVQPRYSNSVLPTGVG